MKNCIRITAFAFVFSVLLLFSCNNFLQDFENYSGDNFQSIIYIRSSEGFFVSENRRDFYTPGVFSGIIMAIAANPYGIYLNADMNTLYTGEWKKGKREIVPGSYSSLSAVVAGKGNSFYFGSGIGLNRFNFDLYAAGSNRFVEVVQTFTTLNSIFVASYKSREVIIIFDNTDWYISRDGGKSFTELTFMNNIKKVANRDMNTLLFIDTVGNMFYSTDGGETAVPVVSPTLVAFDDFAVARDGRVYIYTDGALYYTDGSLDSDTWVPKSSLPGVADWLAVDSAGRVYLFIGSELHISDDDGDSFMGPYFMPFTLVNNVHIIDTFIYDN